MTLLPHALYYASRGLRVLPLEPGAKVPLRGTRGCTGATTNERRIRSWWRQCPKAGIGIVPGPRLWVLDVDAKPPQVDDRKRKGRELIDGHEALRRLEEHDYRLPVTLTAKTPGGGLHFWFTGGEGMRPSKYAIMRGALAGLDVRGEDSYVVAPPTKTTAGEYAWILRVKLQPAPPWLLTLLARKDEREAEPVKPLPTGISEDERARRWGEVVVRNAAERVAQTAAGRHDTWFREALLVGGVVGAGLHDGERARTMLEQAAQGTVKGRRAEIRRTIDQGMHAGSARPVFPERQG